MSAVSFAASGGATPGVPAGKTDQPGATSSSDQQIEKQQHDQELAAEQRKDADLQQIFHTQATSNALANAEAATTLGAVVSSAVSSAKASAAAALTTFSITSTAHGAAAGTGGLESAASAVAGARAVINDAKIAALREPQHGDLADLVQLDQQAANAQGTIVVNLIV